MNPAAGRPDGHAMQCMEIRGGSQPVEAAVSTPGLDLWVSSQPHRGAASGGDVHYVSLCGGGTITRLILADISGHGESVAEFSAALRSLMRKNINTKSQTRLVRALNQQFGAQARLRRFATAVVATYLATDRRLTVCNAGHPRPLRYCAATGEWGLLDEKSQGGGNLPLGIDDASAYAQFGFELGEGDVVVFYTDALIEAANSSRQLLGEQGLLAQARALTPGNPHQVGEALLDAAASHRDGLPADDDTTILVLRHRGGGPRRLSVGEKLDVYAKVFGIKGY
jgi:serine phosphatase RsbU (regulator of sigma subunit)